MPLWLVRLLAGTRLHYYVKRAAFIQWHTLLTYPIHATRFVLHARLPPWYDEQWVHKKGTTWYRDRYDGKIKKHRRIFRCRRIFR